MTTDQRLFEASPALPQSDIKLSPMRLLIFLASLIFISEIFAMIVLYFIQIPNYFWNTVLDGSIMVLLILPGLYLLQLQPLIAQIEVRDRVERALRSNEDLLRKVLELLPVGVQVVEKSGRIVNDNPKSRQIWEGALDSGIERFDQIKGWWPTSGKQLEPHEWGSIRAIQHGVSSLQEEIEIEALDGRRKVILNSAVPILDDQKAIWGAVVVNQDITDRRQAEKERAQLSELSERFFSSISTLIAYMDRDFNFIRVNDAYALAAGHPPEFFIGKNHFDLFPYPGNEEIFRGVVESSEPFSVLERKFEYAEYPERGATYWDWSLQPVKTPDGQVEGLVLSLVDVTERKLADLKLTERNEELRELYQSEANARQFAETLREASQALAETLDLEHVMQTLLDTMNKIVPAELGIVTLLEDEKSLVVRAMRNYGTCPIDEQAVQAFSNDSLAGSVLERLKMSPKSLTIPHIPIHLSRQEPACLERIHLWLVTPIIVGHKIIGLVELGSLAEDGFDPDQISRVEALVAQAGVAIQNAWLFERARASSERLQALATKLVEVQESEREHIARELHDEAGQALSSIKLGLGRLEQDSECPQPIRERLRDLKGVADGVLEELHRLALDLRPAALDRLGLEAALRQYTNQLSHEDLVVQFKAVGISDHRLPHDMETSIYRIVQEATTNALRHAKASYISILLEHGDLIKVLIEDDGVGFDPTQVDIGQHIGVVGMRERAEMLGGSLTIESTPGMGTTIGLEVPDVHSNLNR